MIGAIMATKPILIVVGTNRPGANALRIGKIIQGMYQKAGEAVDLYGLDQMPREIFDSSSYATKPAAWVEVQQRVVDAKGLHIVTPEYNYSIPAVLKNALDWASRPPEAPLTGKPVGLMGASTGNFGTVRAQLHLRQVCVFTNMHPLNKPEVLVPRAMEKLDTEGHLTDEPTCGYVHDLLVALAAWTRPLVA